MSWLISAICEIVLTACVIFLATVSFVGGRKGWGVGYVLLAIIDAFGAVFDFVVKPEVSTVSNIINIVCASIMFFIVIAYICAIIKYPKKNRRIDYRDVY
jgi:hypothetical protein